MYGVDSVILCFHIFIVHSQFALTAVALLMLVITSRIHPYTKKWTNIAEALVLLDLVFISAYFLDSNRLSSTSDLISVLLVLPYIYCFLYLLIKILR